MAGIVFSEASGVTDSIFGKVQAPIKQFLEKRGEAFETMSITKKIFRQDKSTHFAEMYTSLTAMDGFQAVGENGAYPTDSMEEGPRKMIESIEWKDSFRISKKIIEDAQMMDLRRRPQAFITAFYRGREKLGAAALGNAIKGNAKMKFSGAEIDLKTADGQNLFSTGHPAKVKGANQTNLYSNAFSEDALGLAETAMQNFKDENDNIIAVNPDTIIIPNIHSLKKAVFAAIGSEQVPGSGNNDFNYQVGRWNVIIWSYLNQYITAGTAPGILMDSQYNEDYGSLIWQDRVALEVSSKIDDNTDANVWRGRARYTVGFHDWRAVAVGGVAGGTALS